jgi:hypothetical protein
MISDDRLNPTVFDHAGLPLTPILECITNDMRYYSRGWAPYSKMLDCNVWGCNWYGGQQLSCSGVLCIVGLFVAQKSGVVCIKHAKNTNGTLTHTVTTKSTHIQQQ